MPASVVAPPGFSPTFLRAIDEALAFNASKRPRDVPHWRALLQGAESPTALESTVLRAEPGDRHEGRSRHAAPPARRSRRGLWWGLAGLLAVAVAGAGVLLASRDLVDPFGALTAMIGGDAGGGAAPAAAGQGGSGETPTQVADADGDGGQAAAAQAAREAEQRRAAEEQARREAEELARIQAEREARVAELLRAAAADTAAGRLAPPDSPNALERYRQVLALQPDNGDAEAGLAAVRGTLVARTREAMAAGDLETADRSLRHAESIDVNAPEVVEARALYEVAAAAVEAMRQRERERVAAEQARQAEEAARAAAEEEARRAEAEARAAAEAEARQREEEVRRQVEAERARIEAEARRQVEEEMRRAEEEAARQAALEAERAAEEEARLQAEREAELARVETLLSQAQTHMDELRMTGPPGHNALELLREVMEIQPGNEQAQAGIDHIVSFYVDVAGKAARQGEPARAAGFLDRAAMASPSDARVAEARAELAAGRLGAAQPAPAASAPSTAPAPQAAPSRPTVAYIGAMCTRCGAQFQRQVDDMGRKVRAAIEAAAGSVTLHSAPWQGTPIGDAGDFNRFWTGPRTMGADPRSRDVAELGRRFGADAVLMALMVELNEVNVALFLVDTATGRVSKAEGVLRQGQELATRLLARWSADFTRTEAPAPRPAGQELRLGFIGQWCVRCDTYAKSNLAAFERGARTAFGSMPGVVLAASPWGDTPLPVRAKQDHLWDGAWSLTTLEPRVDELAAIARSSGLDGVLVGAVGLGMGSAYESRAFLVSAADGRLFEVKGSVDDATEQVRDVLGDWLSGAGR